MPPRIVTISDHIDCPTGFGVQHRHVAVGLARAGLEVHSLGIWDTRPLETVAVEKGLSVVGYLTRYPGGLGAEDHRRAWAMYRDLLRPDLVITLGDLRSFAHLARGPRPFAWCHWLPLDALPYPAREHATLLRLDHLVLMSHFAMAVVRPRLEGRVPLHHIPHGVDVGAFRPLDDPLALRRRWTSGATGRPPLRTLDGSPLRPDDFILVSRDANQWRKQQPLLFEALAGLPRDVKLVLHGHPVAHPNAHGWNLPQGAAMYGVADRVAFTSPVEPERPERPEPPGYRLSVVGYRGRKGKTGSGLSGSGPENRPPTTDNRFLPLSPSELAELDNLADLRVSATMGEGFGVLTIEAMACGTPTVITDYTTARELVLGDAPSLERPGVRLSVFGGRDSKPEHPPSRTVGAGPTVAPDRSAASSPTPKTEHREPTTAPLDGFGPAGELVRIAAWTLEQDRHLLRPLVDTGDLAAKVLALRGDPARLARYAAAGLRRVLARYTVGHMVQAWVELVCKVLG